MIWAERVTHWKEEACMQDFDRKNLRKIALGRPKRRWVNNNKTNLKEI
jgi:hypothetical protein